MSQERLAEKVVCAQIAWPSGHHARLVAISAINNETYGDATSGPTTWPMADVWPRRVARRYRAGKNAFGTAELSARGDGLLFGYLYTGRMTLPFVSNWILMMLELP